MLDPWCVYQDDIPREGDLYLVSAVEIDEWDVQNGCKVTLVSLKLVGRRAPNNPNPPSIDEGIWRKVGPDDNKLQYSAANSNPWQ